MSENNGIQVVMDGQIEYSLNEVIVTARRPPNFDFSQYLFINRMGRFKDYWDYLAGLGRGFLGLPNLPGDEFIDKSNAFKYGYYRGNWAMPWAVEAAGLKGNPSSTSSAFAIGYNGTLAQTATVDAWKLWLTGSALTNSSQYNASQNLTSNGTKTSQGSSKAWTKVESAALKEIGVPAENSGIRALKGTADDAQKFFKAQVDPSTIQEVKPGVFVGKDANGITFTYRASSKSGPPTVDVNGVDGIRKIKFLEGGE